MKDEKYFLGKKILIGVPDHFGLPDRFRENLEAIGLVVYEIPAKTAKAKISPKDYLIHGYKKIFLKDRTHKNRIRARFKTAQQLSIITSFGPMDYTLIIRPDLYEFEIIKKAVSLAKKSIGYQWDGMDRYPDAYNYVSYFDSFFVFDPRDLTKNPEFKLTTNFYFDDLLNDKKAVKNGIFYVGSSLGERTNTLRKIKKILNDTDYETAFFLTYNKHEDHINKADGKFIHYMTDCMNFKENIQKIKEYTCILDIQNTVHQGLSFRVFESIGYEKKLITNNVNIIKFDFYNENNMFIFNEQNLTEIPAFLSKPYQPLPAYIREKYSFSSWLMKVLES